MKEIRRLEALTYLNQAPIRAGNEGDASARVLPVGALLESATPLMKEAASDAGLASNAEHIRSCRGEEVESPVGCNGVASGAFRP